MTINSLPLPSLQYWSCMNEAGMKLNEATSLLGLAVSLMTALDSQLGSLPQLSISNVGGENFSCEKLP